MDISEVKYNLGKPVQLVIPRHSIDCEYILTGCTIRRDDRNQFYYQAELTDTKSNSLAIVCLESIHKIVPPTVGGMTNVRERR